MKYIPIQKLWDKTQSTYKLVILAARRAIDIGEGSAKLVDSPLDTKPGNIAIQEILEGKITYKEKKGE